MLSDNERESVMLKTQKEMMSNTFFYTADHNQVQIYPESKYDQRIKHMYQR